MRRLATAALLTAALFATSSAAQAGVYSDDVAKCLVKSTSPTDQTDLILWIFAAMSSHPDVKPFSNISPKQRNEMDTKAAALVERLLTVDCRAEAVAALKYEGPSSMESSFSTLGQVAMRGLLSHPDVKGAIAGLYSHTDPAKFKALNDDAGITGGPGSATNP